MYLTRLHGLNGDDYAVHQAVMAQFPNQRPLFQTKGGCVTVVSSAKALSAESTEVTVNGDSHLFSLRVNPSKRDKASGKIVGLQGEAIAEWLKRKAAAGGFEILDLRIEDEGIRRSFRQGKTISIRSVFVLGMLKITDRRLFEQALLKGLGRAKRLGFGLVHIFN